MLTIFAFTIALLLPSAVFSDDLLVTVPGSLKLGVPNNIVLHLDSSSSQTVDIQTYNDGNRVAYLQKVVEPGSPTTLSLQLNATDIDRGTTGSRCNASVSLLIQCPALSFRRQMKVLLDCSGASAYIFTDKSIYTPGQTVSLRVACLDWNLTSFEEQLTIDVKNPKGIIIRRWITDIQKGSLFDDSFTIDSNPQFGMWIVDVRPKEDSKVLPMGSIQFEVKEYVVPRYEVKISAPDYIMKSTTPFIITVTATYTYGKPVRGKAAIETGVIYENKYRPIRTDHAEQILVDGVARFRLTVKKIEQGLPYGFPLGGLLRIRAIVTSEGVSLTEEASIEKTVFSAKSVLLDMSRSRAFFKPGLPYDLEVLARTPGGSVVARTEVTLQAFYKTKDSTELSRILFTGNALSKRTTDDSGFADFVFDVPQASVKVKLQIRASGNPWTETELFPEDSANGKYLMIRQRRTPYQICTNSENACGEEQFIVNSSDSGIKITLCYTLICRGEIAVSKCRFASSWPYQIGIKLLPVASPCCKLLVYYQDQQSLVADYIYVYSQLAFSNNISVTPQRTNRPYFAPNEEVSIDIEGIPGTTVYLSAVDEGVQLLGDNRLTAAEMFNNLKGCKLGCDAIGGRDSDTIFHNAGLVFAKKSKATDYNPICFPQAKLEHTFPNLEACCESGRVHCKDCGAGRKNMHTEGIHTEACRTAFSRCCIAANEHDSCSIGGRVRTTRTIGHGSFGSSQDFKPTLYGSYFPESWLKTRAVIGNRGKNTLRVNVPYTINTWHVNAFGISGTGIFGMASPQRLRVFSLIFLEVTSPYSVIRNEQFAVKATVYNYSPATTVDNVAVNMKSHSFDICTTAGTARATEKKTTETIPPKSSHTFLFPVVPLSTGEVTIEVTAELELLREVVIKTVIVEPEGEENEMSFPKLLDPSTNRGQQIFNFNLSSPAHSVRGSVERYLYVTANMLSPVVSLQGFDSLLRQPYGSGEQNMNIFCTNVIVLLYLNNTRQVNKQIFEKRIADIRNGYSRQMMFRRSSPSGSFSALGDNDAHGSTWLTAFVLKCFCLVSKLELNGAIVDPLVIKTGKEWLEKQQELTGQFVDRGRLVNVSLQGGVHNYSHSLTAYVLISFLECSSIVDSIQETQTTVNQRVSPTVTWAAQYLNFSINSYNGSAFESAIVSYALCLVKDLRGAKEGLRKLWHMVRINEVNRTADWVSKSPNKAVSIETAAYAVLAFLCIKDDSYSSLVVNWLNRQPNLDGGFVSTQDTVIAMQALAAYAKIRRGNYSILTISVKNSNESKTQFLQIQSDQANVRQTINVSLSSNVLVSVQGSGTGLIQAGVKYNTLTGSKVCNFSAKVDTKYYEANKTMKIEVRIKYKGLGYTSTAVVSVRLWSGFIVDDESLKRVIREVDLINLYKTEKKSVNFYFNYIPNDQFVSFNFTAKRLIEVAFLQPALVSIYDYYNPDIKCTFSYAPHQESALLSLLCKGSSCQCAAGRCALCQKFENGNKKPDQDRPKCGKKYPQVRVQKQKLTLLVLIRKTCLCDFAYRFTVISSQTLCQNGWIRILGKIVMVYKPGVREINVGDKFRIWKRAECGCPSFKKGQQYLYVGNKGLKFLVDHNSVVLKWETKLFNNYIKFINRKGACETL